MKNLWIIGKIVSVFAALAGMLAVVTAIDIANHYMVEEFYSETAHIIFCIVANVIAVAYVALACLLLSFVFKIKS